MRVGAARKHTVIAIDFDGTLCDHRFPAIGKEAAGAFRWLKKFQEAGAKLVLWTMRSDGCDDGTNPLAEAVQWCLDRGVAFWAVNSNPDQHHWTASPKAYAQAYVDDNAIGCPLRKGPKKDSKAVVDWRIVGPLVMAIIKKRAA